MGRACVVVTGAASGLGRALAMALAPEAGRIVAVDLDAEGLAALAVALKDLGPEVETLALDVARAESWPGIAAAVGEGELGWLVNCAGIAAAGNIEALDAAIWERVMAVDFFGALWGCRTFAPRLRAQGRGRIVNVASRAAFTCPPQMGPYNAAKAALVALSETLRGELRGSGATVTVACPGFFRSPFADRVQSADPRAQVLARRFAEASGRDAAAVAASILADARRGRLHAIPGGEDRTLWRLKRLLPTGLLDLVARKYFEALASEGR